MRTLSHDRIIALPLDRSSKNRLAEKLLHNFSGDTLFDAIARAVCRAGCLPRKELYEAWEVARRVRRRFRGGRIVDLACGHGLLAQILLLLDDSSSGALAVDRRIPKSAATLAESLVGCTVAPGFDFADFGMGNRDLLLEQFPEHVEIIRRMCGIGV